MGQARQTTVFLPFFCLRCLLLGYRPDPQSHCLGFWFAPTFQYLAVCGANGRQLIRAQFAHGLLRCCTCGPIVTCMSRAQHPLWIRRQGGKHHSRHVLPRSILIGSESFICHQGSLKRRTTGAVNRFPPHSPPFSCLDSSVPSLPHVTQFHCVTVLHL